MIEADFAVRPAEPADLDVIAAMWTDMSVQHAMYNQQCWDFREDAAEHYRRQAGEAFEKPGRLLLVAEDTAGQCVGFATGVVGPARKLYKVRRSGEVWDIYVRPESRGRGLGKRLLQAMLDTLAAAGAEDVQIRVAAANDAARRMYSRMGFELVIHEMYMRLEPPRQREPQA